MPQLAKVLFRITEKTEQKGAPDLLDKGNYTRAHTSHVIYENL